MYFWGLEFGGFEGCTLMGFGFGGFGGCALVNFGLQDDIRPLSELCGVGRGSTSSCFTNVFGSSLINP